MTNVVGIDEKSQIRADLKQRLPCASLVEHLEMMLDKARSGEWQGLAYVSFDCEDHIDYNSVGNMIQYTMLGGIVHLQHYMIQKIEE